MGNIFTRFINFIKKIFGHEKSKQLSAKTEERAKQKIKSKFFDSVRVYKEEDPILLNLQNQYETNKIDLCTMSNEQVHNLNLLYKRQISELKKKLNDKKTELSLMQMRIKGYSE